MKEHRKSISIRRLLITVFMAAMLMTVGGIGYLVFSGWYSSAKNTTESMASEMNVHIYNQIYSLLHVPEQINESNHKLIANDIIDIRDGSIRDRFFAGVLSSYEDEIYSFSYGTSDGEYYGARRNEDWEIEIMRNDASTGGNSWYYTANEDLTAGELILKAGLFDPRTRNWYKAAAESGNPTFSPIYKHFIMDDMTVSYACPVYDEQGKLEGILGTHVLLGNIDSYLEDIVSQYKGYAVIIEKSSGELVGNSLADISFEGSDMQRAWLQYKEKPEPEFFYKGTEDGLYINVDEINLPGLDWVVVSAMPEDYLIAPVENSIRLTIMLAVISLIISFIFYNSLMAKVMRPVQELLSAYEEFSSGDMDRRVEILRNDEIGRISESFNNMADKTQFLINHLESTVRNRTQELESANQSLEENKNQLRLVLDSAAEAIYGIDTEGNCTFCNASCIKMLGYSDQSDLLGKDMHELIHHSKKDGTAIPSDECRIFKAYIQGEGAHINDEVFWRADGTCFDAEYFSYPQIRDGEIIGAVVTFMDITERKRSEAELKYLSCHDTLTGLHNRRCFEDNKVLVDNEDNLPLAVIFADINGLKMTNDIFGHAAGDELIMKSAEILQMACRHNDVVARVGGDEFIILLPSTTQDNAQKVIDRIRDDFMEARVKAIKCSIALGLDIKRAPDQSLDEIIANAENKMYKDKMANRKSISRETIDTIIDTIHSKNPDEKKHSADTAMLSVKMGEALGLSQNETIKLKRAGYLHDIGKIVLDDELLATESLNEDELEAIRQHAVVGYRILNLFEDTMDIAEYVYSHHERWDGTGYPRGLTGEQIPLLSRILSVAEAYDRIVNRDEVMHLSIKERKAEALEIIRAASGTRFDPQVVDALLRTQEI